MNPNQINNTTVLKAKPFYHSTAKHSLEDIVEIDKSQIAPSLLDRLVTDRTRTLKATVKALLEEIRIRESLDIHLLKFIDEEISQERNEIFNLENLRVNYTFDRFVEVKKLKLQREDKILELTKEKRQEYLECWRDLMFLKKYLMMALREYWDMVTKKTVLSKERREIDESS